MTSIGGGGAVLVYSAETGKVFAINLDGRLPRAATEDMFVPDLLPPGVNQPSFGWRGTKNDVGWMGYRSLGVPGFVAGMCLIQEEFGTMSLEEVMAPAIRIAEEGWEMDEYNALYISRYMPYLQRFPPIDDLLLPGGYPPHPASRYDATLIVQKELAQSLRLIAKEGPTAFYQGDIAKAIMADTQPHGSIVTLQDYADYKPDLLENGLESSYRGHKIACMPFGGVTLVEMLNLLEQFDLVAMGHNSPQALHTIIECFRQAWVDRLMHMGDPEFEEVPVEGLMSKDYAADMAKLINLERVPDAVRAGNPWAYQGNGKQPTSSKRPSPLGPGHETSYQVSMDKAGNMVTVSQTLGGAFGAMLMSGSTGIILRNYTNLFNPEPGTKISIGPWKKPLSHHCATLIVKDNRPFITIGAPGGRFAPTAVAQVIVNVIDFGMGMQEAIGVARIHAEGTDPQVPKGKLLRKCFLDSRIPPAVVSELERRGHEVVLKPASIFARPLAVLRDHATGKLHSGTAVPVPAMAIGY
jgi:gamma-glutamyltranspeptidase/glutathione hydrolase